MSVIKFNQEVTELNWNAETREATVVTKTIDQSINQSINQSTDMSESINQSINQSINHFVADLCLILINQ